MLHARVIEAIICPIKLGKPQGGRAAFGRGIVHHHFRSGATHGGAEKQQLVHLLNLGTLGRLIRRALLGD